MIGIPLTCSTKVGIMYHCAVVEIKADYASG